MPKSKKRKSAKKKDPAHANTSRMNKIRKGSVSYQAGGLLAFTEDMVKEINHGV
jgi:hypothetical protein